MVAPAIMYYATDAQKSHYLPRIRKASIGGLKGIPSQGQALILPP